MRYRSNVHLIFMAFWCPDCEWRTGGMIDDGKRMRPRCRRELWQCLSCQKYTFGILEDANQCQCGGHMVA